VVESRVPESVRASLRILATHRALFDRRSRGWGLTMTEHEIQRVVAIFETSNAQ